MEGEEGMMQLYHGDCLEELKRVENGSVDMVLTDPPYSSGGLFAGDRRQSTRDKYTDRDFQGAARLPDFSGDNMDQRSFTEFLRMVFAWCRLKLKPGGVLAAFVDWRNLPAITDALQGAGLVWRGIVVWDKGTSRNIPGRFRPDCEYIVWGTNGPRTVSWEPGGSALPGCYHIPGVPSKKRLHQTEKQVELLEKLLMIAPEEGVILDPFMGSGSTGVAAAKTGRSFIGIESEVYYFDTAKDRLLRLEEEKKVG